MPGESHTKGLKSLWLHSVRVAMLKVGAVEISVNLAVKNVLVTASLEDQNRILVLRVGCRCSCAIRNLEGRRDGCIGLQRTDDRYPGLFSR